MDHGMMPGMMGSNTTMSSDDFCMGSGRVMLPGFQVAYGSSNPCVIFLFKGWVLDTAAKYAFAVIGTFVMGMFIELLSFLRKLYVAKFIKQKTPSSSSEGTEPSAYVPKPSLTPFHFAVPFIYGIQMVWAYWAMLLVMLYEAWFFTALILGYVVGNLLFGVLLPSRIDALSDAPNEPGDGVAKCCTPLK